LSTVTFAGLHARTWSPTEGYSEAGTYKANGFVFAVLTATEHARLPRKAREAVVRSA
jgi:hypothetical protein